ncbi:MAG: type IV pilus twitching motility protein PilT [Deltaproteobacteria bacterium]|nr:type IV pilus twitching motility protein PilT [Deltaproteobacteria bacterium]
MKVLLAQPVRADQIQAILKDVVPPEVDYGFTSDGDATFTFDAGGPVTAHLRRYQGRLDALIRPAQAGATVTPSPPTPSTPPPPAPPPPAAARPAPPTPAPPAPPAPPEAPPQPLVAAAPPTPAPAMAAGARKQIDPLLHALVQNKASDLHITANMQPRMRKDGDISLVPGFEATLSSDAIRAMLMEVAPLAAREKFEKSNDADYAYELPGIARFRVNAFKDRRGVSGVLRVIPSKILTFEDLKLPNVVKDFCSLHKGLVVVTGPTGSGKSTTLAAMVDWINRSRTDHIITIEDPVEFVHETKSCLVNQREVHVDTMSFSAALRAALREDPDIVLVGEMRDLETVGIAIETAETGHLVFGTLHTTTAVSTIDRIIDQFPTDRQEQVRMMLSESLKGVIAQTLCKKVGGGRVAALEILVCNTAVANLIREGKTFQIPSMMQTQKQIGMQTLNDALFAHVREGVVAPDDAFAKSVDRTSFKMMLDKANIKLTGH